MVPAKDLAKAADDIAKYLDEQFDHEKGFPARSFYGETFSVLLWSYFDNRYDQTIKKALNVYSEKDKTDPEFHWEFNNYALLHYKLNSNDQHIEKLTTPLNFKGTSVANWTLLRANTRFLAKKSRWFAIKEILKALYTFQLKSGLILDDTSVKSFQYHCFSAAMLFELYQTHHLFWLKNPFSRAVSFIRQFILPNGDSLYIGRGQQQSFGYGTLLYILAGDYIITSNADSLNDMQLVWNFIKGHQREDGSFPLVLNDSEKGYPVNIKGNEKEFPGWYSYNNYFDYLPFLGCFLSKTHQLLTQVKQ